MTLGERIAYYRGKLGLSQGELAEQLGVSRQAVSNGRPMPDCQIWSG